MYDTLPTVEAIQNTIKALSEHHVEAILVQTADEALAKIKEIIPQGASVMNGASRTLEQIGYIEYLKSDTHGWNNLHAGILAETDPEKQARLRKEAVLSDYYLGSVHGLAQTGEFLIASNSGSQLPHIAFTSPHLVFVVSTKKIVPTLADTYVRLNKHVVPLEDERMKKAYGYGTQLNKILVFNNENPALGRTVQMILVNQDLGF